MGCLLLEAVQNIFQREEKYMNRLLCLTIFPLLCFGCASLQVTEKMDQIHGGMSKTDVKSVLGKPSRIGSVTTNAEGQLSEIWIYEEKIRKGAGKAVGKTFGYIVTFGGLAVSEAIMENYTQRKDINVYEFTFVDGILQGVRSQRGERAPGYVVGVDINQQDKEPIQ
jgi:hypothetical protein